MPRRSERRAADILNAIDGLLRTHLEGSPVGAPILANLAATMAIEYSGAVWGALLDEEGGEFRISLEFGERRAGDLDEPDAALVERAVADHRLAVGATAIAAPVIDAGRVCAVLYLHFSQSPPTDAEDLAQAVALRIGALLQSTSLVAELSRRTRNVALLEGLGACLAAGTLANQHLDRALEGAAQATNSPQGLLVVTEPGGKPLRIQVFGEPKTGLRELAHRLARRVRHGDEPVDDLLGENYLFEALRTELVPDPGSGTESGSVGFLMVRDADAPYVRADRSFFNAVVHLMNGALARLDFFRRAAEDPLTETGSRLALRLKLSEAQATSLKTGKPFSLLLVDLDHFKVINDRHGHLVGDEVLRELADLLRSRLRADDSVARFGGDEFVLILPLTGAREAQLLAEELRQLVGGHRFTGRQIDISVSIGVSTHRVAAQGLDDVLQRADEALYASKSGGRDRVTMAGRSDSNGAA